MDGGKIVAVMGHKADILRVIDGEMAILSKNVIIAVTQGKNKRTYNCVGGISH